MNHANRLIFSCARRAPLALGLLIAPHAHQVKHRPAKLAERSARDRHLSETDRAVMIESRLRDLMITAAPEAFRQGIRGVVQEAHISAGPWGFDPATIKPPVFLWHGDQDANVPVAMARDLASRIPGGSITIYPGEGHLIVPEHWPEIQATLLSQDVTQRYPG